MANYPLKTPREKNEHLQFYFLSFSGMQFNPITSSYENALLWDEAFCRRHKMPLCMSDLDDACTIMGDAITSDVVSYSCDGYSRCIDGNMTEFFCDDGMMFSVRVRNKPKFLIPSES